MTPDAGPNNALDAAQAALERAAPLDFLKSLDRIHRAVQWPSDLDQALGEALDAVLAIFQCDRAWLLFPCDAESASCRVPMERTRPEWPGACELKVELPLKPDVATVMRIVSAADGPVQFGPGEDNPVPESLRRDFRVQSMMAMVLRPKVGKTWMFGLHQCAHARIWTSPEEGLFREVGRRLTDALTGLLAYRELRESEARSERAQQMAHLGYWERDLATNRHTWSDETYRILGLPPQSGALTFEQLLGRVHPEDQQRVKSAMAGALGDGGRYDLEYRIVRPNGEVRFVHSQGDVNREVSGRGRRMLGVVQDITERKRADEALKGLESLYHRAIMAAGAVPYHRDYDTSVFTYIGERIQDLTGYSRQEMTPALWESLIQEYRFHGPLAGLSFPEAVRKVRSREVDQWHCDCRILTASGQMRWVADASAEILDEDGRAIGSVGALQDITDRQGVEESLALFRSLIDHASDAIEVVDPATGRILDVNERACRAHGYTREEYLALRVADLDPIVGARPWEQGLEGLRQAGSKVVESQHRRKDGSVFPVEINLTYIHLHSDYVVAVVRDITERKKLEADLLRVQRLEGLGTLASGIAHDLNNVLAPILMSSQLLQKSATSQESRKLAQTMQRAAQRGADVVKQVLAFARGADGEKSVLQPVDVIRELVRFLQETFPKSLVITSRLQSGLRRVMANPTQLHQVLLNLCLNARDAMPAGGALEVRAENVEVDPLQVRRTPQATPGPYVLIQVRDTGVGISQEVLDRIFDPFFTTKPFGHGTGLGLSMALGIVKSLGGFILVESEPDKGSAFSVYLPASPCEKGTTAEAPAPSVAGRGRGETILVVDDEQAILDLASCALQRQGYRVLTSTRGNQALALFNQNPAGIKLVITDIMMPGMDGWTLLRTLRNLAPGLKMAAWSGAESDPPGGDHPGGNPQAPVDVFIAKPFTVDSLLNTVSELLRGGPPQSDITYSIQSPA
jgi:PAS domain S-box-containing protein